MGLPKALGSAGPGWFSHFTAFSSYLSSLVKLCTWICVVAPRNQWQHLTIFLSSLVFNQVYVVVFCTSRFYQQLGKGQDKRKLTCGFAFRTKTMFEEEKNYFFLQAVLTMCWRSLCQISLKHGPVVSWRKANIGAWQLAGEKDMPEKANISAMFHPNSWTSMKNSPK